MKTQIQLANRAWRQLTKSYGWDKGWKGGKKAWKSFCRDNAVCTVESRAQMLDKPFENQADATEAVDEELSYWD